MSIAYLFNVNTFIIIDKNEYDYSDESLLNLINVLKKNFSIVDDIFLKNDRIFSICLTKGYFKNNIGFYTIMQMFLVRLKKLILDRRTNGEDVSSLFNIFDTIIPVLNTYVLDKLNINEDINVFDQSFTIVDNGLSANELKVIKTLKNGVTTIYNELNKTRNIVKANQTVNTKIIQKVVDSEKEASDKFFSNIYQSKNDLKLFKITNDVLEKSGYIDKIGQEYYTDDVDSYRNNNYLNKLDVLFTIINYYFKNIGLSFDQNSSDLKQNNNGPLNQLFFSLIKRNDLGSIVSLVANTFATDDLILTKMIKDKMFNLSVVESSSKRQSLEKILLILSSIIEEFGSLNSFIVPLYAWYDKYHDTYIEPSNQNFLDVKEGFIVSSSNTKTRKLQYESDGNAKIAELVVIDESGRNKSFSYATYVYRLFAASYMFSPYKDEKKKISSKDRERYNTFLNKKYVDDLKRNVKFELDFWQVECKRLANEGKSFIVSAPTSSGKTHMVPELLNEGLCLYIAPTDPLAFQVYCNILETFKASGKNDIVCICSGDLEPKREDYRILVGTPAKLITYLSSKDFSHYNQNNKQSLEKVLDNVTYKLFDKIIIDEIHTLSPDYDLTLEGKMRAKQTSVLLDCLNNSSKLIGLSATLSDGTLAKLQTLISEKTNVDVEIVKVSFDDIGRKYEGQYIDPNNREIQPQKKYVLSLDVENDIKTINKYADLQAVDFLEINGYTLFKTLKSVVKWGNIPTGVYTGDNSSIMNAYQKLVEYLEVESNKCKIWNDLAYRFNRSGLNIDATGADTWLNEIYSSYLIASKNLLDDNLEKFDDNVELINNANSQLYLIGIGKRGVNDEPDEPAITKENSPYITPEMYGLIYEIANFKYFFSKQVKTPFSGKHPYFRFIDNFSESGLFKLKDVLGKPTPFAIMLNLEGIDVNDSDKGLTGIILKGVQYGVGLNTSDTPFAIQCEINSYLKRVKENKPLPITFNDQNMTMGVDYDYMSSLIINMVMQNIKKSVYDQISGRAGRRGRYPGKTADVYLLNVANYNSLGNVEDQDFNYNGISEFYYTGKTLISSVIEFIKYYVEHETNNIIKLENINQYAILINNDYFQHKSNVSRENFRLMKLQVYELFARLKDVNNLISNTYLREIYNFIQKLEFNYIKN